MQAARCHNLGMLNPNRYFHPEPGTRQIARELYEIAAQFPLVCPHGHVDPRILAENSPFPDPSELLIIPDHYVFRMLYSQGVSLESLGIPRKDGGWTEADRRKIWQIFADHYYLFRGTPSWCWLRQEFADVFEIEERLDSGNAMRLYDRIAAKLAEPEFRPRALFERFRIQVLCTTDAATDDLAHHRKIRESGWGGDVRPTFRPDIVMTLLHPSWRESIGQMEKQTGISIGGYRAYIQALERRREFFKTMGCTCTDHAVLEPYTAELSTQKAEEIFIRALGGHATVEDDRLFTAHMLMEMARMSVADGLVMQLHPGSFRNHNQSVFDRFGPDKGCDIPVSTEYTRNLRALLNKYGNESRFRLVLFTLDESSYSRELAPLAGHYPALRLGPAWWFHDSLEGMMRFRKMVTETAGIYNTVGFNDDTRAFLSIPARHDLSRRVDSNFLAEQVATHVIEKEEAEEMIRDLSYRLVRKTYGFDR